MLPYTVNYNKLPAFFSVLYTSAVPQKVTYRFIYSLDFKSSKNRDLYAFLQSFGFITQEGFPTANYIEFKKATSPQAFVSVCAKNIYEKILGDLPNLDSIEKVSLFLSNKYPEASSQQVKLMFLTLQALNMYASFIHPHEGGLEATPLKKRPINININLPETENPAIYETIFKYLKDILGS